MDAFDFTVEAAAAYEKYSEQEDSKFDGFKPEQVAVKHDRLVDFIGVFQAVCNDYDRMLFKNLMRLEWLDRKIAYKGATKLDRLGGNINNALANFYYLHARCSRVWFYNDINAAIISYADELFPDFNEVDGLIYDFSFPFKWMNLDCLFLVHKLKDRKYLLDEGEKHQMDWLQFQDYVAAYGSDRHYRFKETMVPYNRFFVDSSLYMKLYPPGHIPEVRGVEGIKLKKL